MYVLHNTLESTAFESKLATITSLLTDISFCRQKNLANIGAKTHPWSWGKTDPLKDL